MRLRLAALAVSTLSLTACPPERVAGVAVDPGYDGGFEDRPPLLPDEHPATPAPTAKVAEPGTTLFVAESLADCQGEAPMKCMRIRASSEEAWRLHYGTIDGFTYEPGFAYELRVERVDVAKPAADAASFRYRLIEVVSKRKAP